MGKTIRYSVLVFGLIILICGIAFNSIYDEEYESCRDPSYEALNEEACSYAWFMYGFGLVGQWVGFFFCIIGLVLVVTMKRDPTKLKYTCPQCSAKVSFGSSCPECGTQIDWSGIV